MTKAFPLRLPDETYEALKAVSTLEGTSMNSLASEAIQHSLSDYARKRQVEHLVDETRTRYADVLELLKDS